MGKRLYSRIENLFKDVKIINQSVELVGQKVQGNPDHFNWNTLENNDYGIVFHGSEVFKPELNQDNIFNNLQKIAQEIAIEGWVIYYQKKAWKLRMNMLQTKEKCLYNDKNETSIKPFVY